MKGYIGIMEKKMETTIIKRLCKGIILGFIIWDNGKENGNIWGLYWGYIGIMIEKGNSRV